jgi:hypothetical protein
MMLVFWGLITVGLVLGLRWLVSQGREPRSDAALDILCQRYVRSEIERRSLKLRSDISARPCLTKI